MTAKKIKTTSGRGGLTYYARRESKCPVCSHTFFHEELHKGGGRLISDQLTDELHQQYTPSKKYGVVYPLIYPLYVCPSCYFAVFKQDFENVSGETLKDLQAKGDERKQALEGIILDFDFFRPRQLNDGIAGYLLAMFSYDSFLDAASPVFKQGLCALRAGWLCVYLHNEFSDQQYLYLHRHLMRKASFLYNYCIELEQKKRQAVSNEPFTGPDVHRSYGYEGVLYLSGLLELRYGSKENLEIRLKRLSQTRSTIGRMFGFGKSSKEKPSAILSLTRDLYEALSDEIQLLSVSR